MLDTLLPPQTYFSIREVSQLTAVKPYVIRYWETQFSALRPARRESGQRKFTQKDVEEWHVLCGGHHVKATGGLEFRDAEFKPLATP